MNEKISKSMNLSNLIPTCKTSLENKEVESVQQVQMNIYQSNRKDLRWLHFYDDPKVQERPQMLDQYPYIPVSVTS